MCSVLFLEKQHGSAYVFVTKMLYYKQVHCSASVFSKWTYMCAVRGEVESNLTAFASSLDISGKSAEVDVLFTWAAVFRDARLKRRPKVIPVVLRLCDSLRGTRGEAAKASAGA